MGFVPVVYGFKEKALEFSRIQKMAEDRGVTCFGQHDPKSDICKGCVLSKMNHCQSFQAYLAEHEQHKQLGGVLIVEGDTEIWIDDVIAKAGYKSPNTKNYKAAKVILGGNNKPITEVINALQPIYGNIAYSTLKSKFRIICQRINKCTSVKIKKVVYLKVVQK